MSSKAEQVATIKLAVLPQKSERAATTLRQLTNLDQVLWDTVTVFDGSRFVEEMTEHRLSDFFGEVSIDREDSSNAALFTVFLHPRNDAPPFWKDMVVMLSKRIHEELSVNPELESLSLAEAARSPVRAFDENVRVADPEDLALTEWFHGLGPNSREFWTVVVKYLAVHETFTFDELASFSGIGLETLKAGHRNSYRRAMSRPAGIDPLITRAITSSGKHIYAMNSRALKLLSRLSK